MSRNTKGLRIQSGPGQDPVFPTQEKGGTRKRLEVSGRREPGTPGERSLSIDRDHAGQGRLSHQGHEQCGPGQKRDPQKKEVEKGVWPSHGAGTCGGRHSCLGKDLNRAVNGHRTGHLPGKVTAGEPERTRESAEGSQ